MPAPTGKLSSLSLLAMGGVLLGFTASGAIGLPLSTTTLTVPLPTITVTVPTSTLTLPRTTTTVGVPPTTTVTFRLPTTTVTVPTTITLPRTTTTLSVPTTTITLRLPTTTLAVSPTTTLTVPVSTTGTLPDPTTTTIPVGTAITLPTTTTISAGPPTTFPEPGTCAPAGCDDGNPCTADRCDPLLGCQHEPLTGPACDDGDPCTSDDHCSAGLCAGARIGCVAAPRCPETCVDDGFSCTDEVCTAAGCLHVPVDSRCVQPGQCTTAVCAPELPGADEAGCVPGVARADGQACAEDADACTLDVCRGGECVHERTTPTDECAPVQGVFRETLALGELTGDLVAEVSSQPGAGTLVVQLMRVQEDLAAAARALTGAQADFVPATPRAAEVNGSPAGVRARIAFTHILRTPREVVTFLQQVGAAEARRQLAAGVARKLRRSGRRLLAGTRLLKAELRQLAGPRDRTKARRRRAIGPRLQTSADRL